MILDFRNCKTAEDVEKVFKKSKISESLSTLKEATKNNEKGEARNK